jgi:hypothetical protein
MSCKIKPHMDGVASNAKQPISQWPLERFPAACCVQATCICPGLTNLSWGGTKNMQARSCLGCTTDCRKEKGKKKDAVHIAAATTETISSANTETIIYICWYPVVVCNLFRISTCTCCKQLRDIGNIEEKVASGIKLTLPWEGFGVCKTAYIGGWGGGGKGGGTSVAGIPVWKATLTIRKLLDWHERIHDTSHLYKPLYIYNTTNANT